VTKIVELTFSEMEKSLGKENWGGIQNYGLNVRCHVPSMLVGVIILARHHTNSVLPWAMASACTIHLQQPEQVSTAKALSCYK
jgi:hypothetical protein